MSVVSILIPIFNEKNFILETIRRVEQVLLEGLQKEIILIDDGSSDGSREILALLGNRYKVILHEKNRGVGAAMRSGIQASHGDYIVRQDVDLEYDPNNLPRLLEPLINNRADIVYGSRTMSQKKSYTSLYNIGSRSINLLFNLLFWNRIYNFTTAAKAFKREVFDTIVLVEDRFETESELSAKAIRYGFRIVNVPIVYHARTMEEGKKMRWYYTFRIIWTLFKYRFVPL